MNRRRKKMNPQLLREYLEVITDWAIGVGGVALAIYLLANGQGADNIAGSVAAMGAAIQSFRKNTVGSITGTGN